MDNPALPQAQQWATAEKFPEKYSFSPIKALRTLPRLWERKPSTPFRSGVKPKKLWKRFHSSFSNMQTVQSSAAEDNNAFQIAINSSKEAVQVRGVKRLRVDDEIRNSGDNEKKQLETAFLETQWQSDSRKRRKLPDAPIDIFEDKIQDCEGDWAMTDLPRPLNARLPPNKTTVFHDGATDIKELNPQVSVDQIHVSGLSDGAQKAVTNDTLVDENTYTASAPSTSGVEKLTQEQEGTLVRSALRSSLDGDDRELLNSFVSRAQAKRAAKAMMQQEVEDDKPSSPEETLDSEDGTPRSRRALETLDTNSPSPVKVPVSPSKGDIIPGDESQEREASTEQADDIANTGSPNPTARRSTRVKVPTVQLPTGRNTISLRRAKGNEFIFVQRTEAQRLALATKQHTRQNRGDSISPKYVLEMMANGDYQDATVEGNSTERTGAKASRSRAQTAKKSVSWNDARLVEFEDDEAVGEHCSESEESKEDAPGSTKTRGKAKQLEKKSSRSQRSRSQAKQEATSTDGSADSDSGSNASAAAAAAPSAPAPAPASRSRRVRRLGESSMISGTPVKTGSGRISKPPAQSASTSNTVGPSTPTKARRKLVPKSPSMSMLPISKAAGATVDQHFVSGIPMRSSSTSTGASEGTRRKSAAQASAGCTPMPRRVRARS